MDNKFTIGSQWKCRDGHRAVVVEISKPTTLLNVWHENKNLTGWHRTDGYWANNVHPNDLLTPWTEPKTGEFYTNVYEKNTIAGSYSSKAEADLHVPKSFDRIACVRVAWTEGQFDE